MSNKSNLEKVLENSEEAKLVIDDFSESAHRVRRNLLIFSVIALFYALSGGAQSGTEVNIYGIKFSDSNPNLITWFLLAILLYHLIHFVLIAFSHWQYLRIRVTREIIAPRVAIEGGNTFGPPDLLIKNLPDPKHSSFAQLFFFEVKKQMTSVSGKESILNFFEQKLSEYENISLENDEKKNLKEANDNLKKIKESFDKIEKLLTEKELKKSLEKFNRSFGLYRSIELKRFFLIEMLLPLVVGLGGFVSLLFVLFERFSC